MRELTKSLVLIVWNEIEGCRSDVPRIDRKPFAEIFAIDGGSNDGTVEYLESQGIPVFAQRQRSLNAAYADAAFRSKAEAVVVFFPKTTLDPIVLTELCRKLEDGYDLVIASRNLPGARNEEDDRFFKPRKWGVEVLSVTTALLWHREGWRIRDVLHGVKAFTQDAFRKMQISTVGVTVDLEMTARAYQLRIPRTEIAVIEKTRSQRESRFKIWPVGKQLGGFLVAELFRKLGN